MTSKEIESIKANIKDKLIHCITNPISINLCANGILAVGAKPIMAEHPKEVEEITLNSSSLAVNIGNITDIRMESIILSSKAAKKIGIPFIIDVVGVGCSKLRKDYAIKYINEMSPTVVKGNISEIKALVTGHTTKGVDALEQDRIDLNSKIAIEELEKIAKQFKTIIVATSKTDVITDGKRTILVDNGSKMLSKVTGTGCLLNCLIGTFLAGTDNYLDACIYATAMLGVCGELSETEKGTGQYQINLLNNLSTIDTDTLIKKMKIY